MSKRVSRGVVQGVGYGGVERGGLGGCPGGVSRGCLGGCLMSINISSVVKKTRTRISFRVYSQI